jgi:hypothetical protein
MLVAARQVFPTGTLARRAVYTRMNRLRYFPRLLFTHLQKLFQLSTDLVGLLPLARPPMLFPKVALKNLPPGQESVGLQATGTCLSPFLICFSQH